MDENLLLHCEIKIEEEELIGDNISQDSWPDYNSLSIVGSFGGNKNIKIGMPPSKKPKLNKKGKRSKRKNTWSDYVKKQASLQIFNCTKCSFETSWKCYLKSHMKKIHGPPEDTPVYQCLQCKFKTKWRFSLVNHMKVHCSPETLKMHKCPKCSYETKWNNGLTSHMKVHMLPKIVKIYNCEKCSYETKSKVDLAAHVKMTHEPPQPMYKCPLCTFQTTFRHGVNKHLKVHNWRK